MKIGLIGNIVLDEITTMDGNIKSNYINPRDNGRLVDATGCGDAYAATFALEYLRGSGAIRSAEIANNVAGAVSTMRGVEEMLSTDYNYFIGKNG